MRRRSQGPFLIGCFGGYHGARVEPAKPAAVVEPAALEPADPAAVVEPAALEPAEPAVLVEPSKPAALVEPSEPAALIEPASVQPSSYDDPDGPPLAELVTASKRHAAERHAAELVAASERHAAELIATSERHTAELVATSERHAADLASSQAKIDQLRTEAVAKDGELERLKLENLTLHSELIKQRDAKDGELERLKLENLTLHSELIKQRDAEGDVARKSSTISTSKKRERINWSAKEIVALKKAVAKLAPKRKGKQPQIPWIQILEQSKGAFHQSRRPNSLKQKWKGIKDGEKRAAKRRKV